VSESPRPVRLDPGLAQRFRAAGERVTFRELPSATPTLGGRVRVARLHEEEARVEELPVAGGALLRVESGPVGALLVLLEAERRGETPALRAVAGGAEPGFPNGAIEARWGTDSGPSTVGVEDLVEVARYALV
jgi:hypothetical protein